MIAARASFSATTKATMTPLSTRELQKSLKREARKHSAQLRAAAAKCIATGNAEWWSQVVLQNGDVFLAADAFSPPQGCLPESTDDPATAANFLLLVSFALH